MADGQVDAADSGAGAVSPGRSARAEEVERAVGELVGRPDEVERGELHALAMMIVDGALDADEPALVLGQKGLQELYGRQLRLSSPSSEQIEQRGQVIGLLDVINWAYRRLLPVGLVAGLEPNGYARRILEEIGRHPGISNEELTEALAIETTEVSRVGRRLVDSGLARKRKVGRRNHWELTGRGRQSLSTITPFNPASRSVLEPEDESERRAGGITVAVDADVVPILAEQVLEVEEFRATFGRRQSPLAALHGRIFSTVVTADEPVSPEDIAQMTSISRRVVDSTVASLIDHGYMRQESSAASKRLRRNAPLYLNMEQYCAIGVKISLHRLVGVMTDVRANSIGPTVSRDIVDSEDPENIISTVADLVRELRDRVDAPEQIIGLGIELGGHIDPHTGDVVTTPNLNWTLNRFPLAKRLERATGLMVVVENDINALAIHEHLFGAARGCARFALVAIGTSIGCGIVRDGHIEHGASGMVGEIGHIPIGPMSRPCRCGRWGCLESVASTTAIAHAVGEEYSDRSMTFDRAVQLADGGEEQAITAIRDAGMFIGRAVVIVQNLHDPERVIVAVPPQLQGTSGRSSEEFRRALLNSVACHRFSASDRQDVDIIQLPREEHGARGAASTVLRRFIQRPLSTHPQATALTNDPVAQIKLFRTGERTVTFNRHDVVLGADAIDDPLRRLSDQITIVTDG
jgi:predicted NBD/HSP70 family sugar kinase/DNA-binding MarR family transcriptional regulator